MWRPLPGGRTSRSRRCEQCRATRQTTGFEAFRAMTDQGRYIHACDSPMGGARRHLQLTVPACGLPVRLARQVTREVLIDWGLARVEETAVLLVSELVTNAVRHATCSDAITLELEV